jgi:hypothetical protein
MARLFVIALRTGLVAIVAVVAEFRWFEATAQDSRAEAARARAQAAQGPLGALVSSKPSPDIKPVSPTLR